MTSSILCSGCGAQLRLSTELVRKLSGRTGRLSCKLCGAKLRIDGRAGPLTVRLDGGGSVGSESAASLLTRVSASSDPAPDFEAHELESVAPAPEEEFVDAAPFLVDSAPEAAPPELKSEPIPSIFELARQSLQAKPKKRLSVPAPRDVAETLSPHVHDDEPERPLPSSPEAERREELRALYDEVLLPPPPAAGSITSRAPRPPLRSSAAPRSSSVPLEAPLLAPSLPSSAGIRPSVPPLQPAGAVLSSGAPLAMSIAPSTAPPAVSRSGMWLAMLAAGLLGGLISAPAQRWISEAFATGGGPSARPLAAASLRVRPELPEPLPLASSFSFRAVGEATPATSVVRPEAPRRKSERSEAPDLKPLPPASVEASSVEPEPPELPAFDETSASVALRQATIAAGGCRSEGDPTGQTKIVVTFAPSGRATTATLSGPPFAGTETGSCIAARFRSVRVAPFSGEHVTLTRDVVIY